MRKNLLCIDIENFSISTLKQYLAAMLRPIYLLFILGLTVSACKKPPVPESNQDNTENEDNKPSPYIGSWSYSNIDMENGTLKTQGQSFGTFTGSGKDMVGSIEVSEDPNVFTAELEYTAALNITIFGQTQQSDFPVEKRTVTGTWEEVNGKLVLTADDNTPLNVISSSENEIIFTGEFSEQVSFGQFNLDALSDVEFTVIK